MSLRGAAPGKTTQATERWQRRRTLPPLRKSEPVRRIVSARSGRPGSPRPAGAVGRDQDPPPPLQAVTPDLGVPRLFCSSLDPSLQHNEIRQTYSGDLDGATLTPIRTAAPTRRPGTTPRGSRLRAACLADIL